MCAVSDAFRKFVHRVVPIIEPYLSFANSRKGSFWPAETFYALSKSSTAVLCVTHANLHSDWLLFEADADAAQFEEGRICTLLIDTKPAELGHPLSFFQSTAIDLADMLQLTETLHGLLPSTPEALRLHFDTWWSQSDMLITEAIA